MEHAALKRLAPLLVPPNHGLRPFAVPGLPELHRRAWNRRVAAAPVRSAAEHAEQVGLRGIERVAGCDLCGTQRFRVLFDVHAGKRRQSHYWVVRCDTCGLLQRQPSIIPERLGELYAGARYGDFLEGHYANRRLRRYRFVLDGFGGRFDHGAGRRLLDFGCGSGLFMDLARERGFDAWGVDLSASAIAKAHERGFADRAFHGDPADVPEIAAGGFDVITLWSVLAHLAEPVADLARLRGLLRPGGVLLALTVNADSLLLMRNGPRWNGFTPNHLQFYAPDTLRTLMLRAGFARTEQPPLLPDQVIAGRAALTRVQDRLLRREILRHNTNNMQRVLAHAPG